MKSKIIVICMLLLMLCSVSIVSAHDINETQMAQSEVNEIPLANNVDDTLSADPEQGSFDDLKNSIDNVCDGSTLYPNTSYTATDDCEIKLDKTLTIDGQGNTIDCNGKCRAFESEYGDITLKNLIIKNGVANYGGAIFSYGSAKFTIINCTFINNHGEYGGGAIYDNAAYNDRAAEKSLTIIDSTFECNSVKENVGGAVYSKGMMTIQNSSFMQNIAPYGGAVYCENTMFVSSSNFTSNHASEYLLRTNEGGAIYCRGDLICEDCNFIGNQAENGGAIFAHSYTLVANNLFENNTAECGGAIYKGGGEYVAVYNSTFRKNIAVSTYGGAIYTATEVLIEDSYFINNRAKNRGGAICTDYIQFSGKSNFTGNTVQNGEGGAIYTNKIATYVTGLYFESNTVDSGDGGALYIFKKSGDVYFSNSTFIRNQATTDGGAIYSDSKSTNFNFNNCIFKENQATGSILTCYGGAICSKGNLNAYCSLFEDNYADNDGGAIYASTIGTVDDSVFISNHAKYGGAIYINDRCTADITKSYFESNYAEKGGAIYTDSSSKSNYLNLINNAFINNNAGEGSVAFHSGSYGDINGNWWGINSPSFDNELIEWQFWGSNLKFQDDDVNTASIIGDADTYNNLNTNIKVIFAKDVPTYLFDKITYSSDSTGDFTGDKINGKTLELTYVPKESSLHRITANVNSQTLTFDLASQFVSVYGYDLVKTQGDSKHYSATFLYANGSYLEPGQQVIFKIKDNDKEFIHNVSDDGIAIFTEISLLECGVYTVIANNTHTHETFENQVTILPKNAVFKINDIFMIKCTGDSFNNENITFKIANETFVSNVTNGTAYFIMEMPAGEYNLSIYCKDKLLAVLDNVTIIDQYAEVPDKIPGENYAALLPISSNEKFKIEGNSSYSVLGENIRRYLFTDGYSAIIYNVTVSNNEEFTEVLRGFTIIP